MQARIGSWGNSLAIRIPRAFAREARLEEGAAVELSISEGRLVLTPIRPKPHLDDLVAVITTDNRHAETDWGRPVGEEAW